MSNATGRELQEMSPRGLLRGRVGVRVGSLARRQGPGGLQAALPAPGCDPGAWLQWPGRGRGPARAGSGLVCSTRCWGQVLGCPLSRMVTPQPPRTLLCLTPCELGADPRACLRGKRLITTSFVSSAFSWPPLPSSGSGPGDGRFQPIPTLHLGKPS